jgi:hypothetical protein
MGQVRVFISRRKRVVQLYNPRHRVPFSSPPTTHGTTVEVFEPDSTLMHKDPVRTSQETHYISATKPNRLMLFGETVAVYSENRTEHTNTLCGQNFDTLKWVVHRVTIGL